MRRRPARGNCGEEPCSEEPCRWRLCSEYGPSFALTREHDDQHKLGAWVHVAGMILLPIIGTMVWKFEGP